MGWHIEYGEAGGERNAMQQGSQGDSKNPHNYNPSPADMTNLTLSKEMMNVAERLSEDAHDIQVRDHLLITSHISGIVRQPIPPVYPGVTPRTTHLP